MQRLTLEEVIKLCTEKANEVGAGKYVNERVCEEITEAVNVVAAPHLPLPYPYAPRDYNIVAFTVKPRPAVGTHGPGVEITPVLNPTPAYLAVRSLKTWGRPLVSGSHPKQKG